MLEQKKRTAFTQSSSSLVGRVGLEPTTKGFRFAWLSPLPGLCLHRSCRLRWVPSSLYTFNSVFTLKLGSALPYVSPHLGFTEFDTIPYTVSTCKAHLRNMSPLLWPTELTPLKKWLYVVDFLGLKQSEKQAQNSKKVCSRCVVIYAPIFLT